MLASKGSRSLSNARKSLRFQGKAFHSAVPPHLPALPEDGGSCAYSAVTVAGARGQQRT